MRDRFRKRSEADLLRLRELSRAQMDTAELRSLVHNLSGAAGTFGYPALSAAAMAIDDCYASGVVPERSLFSVLETELVLVTGV